jgi:hypothetical protein
VTGDLRKLGFLQWVGLLVGGVAWTTQHLMGIGTTQAACNVAGHTAWSLSTVTWQAVIAGIALAFVITAEICSVIVFMRTREAEFGSGPPKEGWKGERVPTRLHFFSAASMAANAIFMMIIVLDFVANVFNVACRQG